jgi:hypothetical protein
MILGVLRNQEKRFPSFILVYVLLLASAVFGFCGGVSAGANAWTVGSLVLGICTNATFVIVSIQTLGRTADVRERFAAHLERT